MRRGDGRGVAFLSRLAPPRIPRDTGHAARSAATLWMTGVDFIQGNLVQIVGSGLEFDFSSAVL